MGRILLGLIMIAALAFVLCRIAFRGSHGFFGNW